MAGNLGLLTRLRLRHLRSGARFLLFAGGTDIDEERGFLDRAYQLYLLIFLAVSLALSWSQVIGIVADLAAGIGAAASSWLATELLVLMPALAILAWGISGLRETPLRMSSPDIAWLSRVVRPEEIFVVQIVGSVVCVCAIGALVGTVLATLAAEPWPSWMTATSLALLTARLFALDAVLPRSGTEPRARRVVTVFAGVTVVTLGVGLAVASGLLAAYVPRLFTPYALFVTIFVDAILLTGAVNWSGKANMAFVVDDNELYAARQSLRFLSLVNSGAYKEACRRRRVGCGRQVRRTWHFWSGRAALVSHAVVSLLRRPTSVLGVLQWGLLLVPLGALLIAAQVDVGVLLAWYVTTALALRNPSELAHVFREDCRNRLVRSQLPAGPLELLLLDSLPVIVIALGASAAATVPAAGLLGLEWLPCVLLAWAMVAALVLSAAFDDPQRGMGSGTLRLTGFACGALCLFVIGVVGILGAWPALVCALVIDALLAWSLR